MNYSKILLEALKPMDKMKIEKEEIEEFEIACERCGCDMSEDGSWNGDNDPVCLDCNCSAADDAMDRLKDGGF